MSLAQTSLILMNGRVEQKHPRKRKCLKETYNGEWNNMDERIVLTKEQESAVKSLERAFKKCSDAGVYFHNCYGRLIAYDKNVVDYVDDCVDEPALSCSEGETVEQHGYTIDSFADDNHYIHLIDV